MSIFGNNPFADYTNFIKEQAMSAKQRFEMYRKDYGIQAHGMKNSKEAEKVIRFVFNHQKDLTPDQMKMLIDKGFFKEGIKQNLIAHGKRTNNAAVNNLSTRATAVSPLSKKMEKEAADMASKSFNNNRWIQSFDFAAFMKKHLN
tara:strand:+ start:195 stop:629 length:435 start_codon:yes stop_codon:yes gene_type:complete